MNARELLEQLYAVYSPSEEASEPNVHRSKFDGEGIRNIMMSYFMHKDIKDVFSAIREYIDKMPDEWVIEFLRHQGDTVVEPVNEMKESLTKDDFIKAQKDTAVFPVTFKIPAEEEITVYALRGEKEGEVEYSFEFTGENSFKISNRFEYKRGGFKTVDEALAEATKALKKYYEVKSVKIGEPELR